MFLSGLLAHAQWCWKDQRELDEDKQHCLASVPV